MDDPTLNDEVRQFTHATALLYLDLLSGTQEMRLTDNNHAMLAHFVDFLSRPEGADKEEWQQEVIRVASEATIARALEVKSQGQDRVIMGIEIDIIDDQGSLSLNEDALQHLDYVVASFHRFIWSIFSEQKYFTVDYLINLYLNAVDNPAISVLGHPTRALSKLLNPITPKDYRPLIEKMAKKKIAFEVNIFKDLASEGETLTREVVKICVENQTPITLSLDFHDLREIPFLNGLLIDGEVSEETMTEFFEKNTHVHYRIFRRLIKNIKILKQLGVDRSQVINANNKQFDTWLASRKELATSSLE